MKRKWVFMGISVLMIVILLASCEKKLMFVGSNFSTKNKVEASYKLFTGTEERKVKMKNGQTLTINYQSKVEKGELTIKLYDPDDQLLKDLSTNKSGAEELEANKDGIYRFRITGDNTKGSYEITYNIKTEF